MELSKFLNNFMLKEILTKEQIESLGFVCTNKSFWNKDDLCFVGSTTNLCYNFKTKTIFASNTKTQKGFYEKPCVNINQFKEIINQLNAK
jgi:hypothetical protein